MSREIDILYNDRIRCFACGVVRLTKNKIDNMQYTNSEIANCCFIKFKM